MNPPQVYMCSPSWTLLPPPSPFHPSGLSQCTSPQHPVSCIEPVSPKFLCWSPVIVTVSGNRTFKRVIKVKWGHKGEGLIHRPFTRTSIFIKRGRDTRDACVHRKGHVRTQWEASCLQAKERGLRRNWPCSYLDLYFQAPEGWGTILLLSKPPSMWYCVVLPLVDYRPFSLNLGIEI